MSVVERIVLISGRKKSFGLYVSTGILVLECGEFVPHLVVAVIGADLPVFRQTMEKICESCPCGRASLILPEITSLCSQPSARTNVHYVRSSKTIDFLRSADTSFFRRPDTSPHWLGDRFLLSQCDFSSMRQIAGFGRKIIKGPFAKCLDSQFFLRLHSGQA